MEDPTQSAVKYVKDAWLKLVNELKDLDVILDNLNVHGVFTKEEVSVVQKEKNEYEERRTLLRKITDKGEKACYKFLKTIASMCKRNSGRLSSPTKKKPDASTEDEEFDLQKWISGFSFKSEQTENYYSQGPRSCCRYQEKLKSKALKKSKKFWMGDRSLFQETYRPDLSYTPLVLDTQGGASASKIKKLKNKKCKKSRPKKLQTYLPEDDLGISPSELLKTQRDILIVGKPGIGKTALSHEILKLWAERDSRELDYMFYFDIRETSHIRDGISLEELLFSEYCEPDEDKEKVSEDIKKYSDNVTIIFDGITDLSSSVVRKIVDGDLLPYAKVIITCRPDDEEEFLPGDFLRVEVKGFNEQTIEKYFSTMLGVDQNKIFSNVELLTLCHVPLYALMVAACFLSETPEDSSQPCSMTEIYINIVRHCLQLNSKTNKKHLNSFIKEKRAELLSLAEAAFHATERKTVSLTDLQCDDSCVLSFLKPLFVQVAPTETTTSYFFLHYTVQEFFAAVWLLKNPDQIKIVFQQCLTEEGKHMKHLIPFMCRLLTKKSPSLMEYLIPVEELNNISDWFFKEMISTFFSAQCMNDEADTEDTGLDESVLFLCQCLFESQSPEACTNFLETLDYQLDLSGEILDSYLCCAVAYVVAQSKERKIQLNLEDASVSEQGMRQLYGCLNNVHWCDPLPRQLWEMVLLSEGQLSNVDLLSLDGNQMHLPVQGKRQLFKRAVSVMKNIPKRINVCLHWDNGATTVSQSLCEALLEALPFVTSLSFRMTHNSPGLEDQESDPRTLERKKKKLLLDLCLKAALDEDQSFHHVVHQLVSMFSVDKHLHNFFVDFYEHVKNKGCSSVRPKLDPLFKSAPKVWSINLSEINTSILLEVLKLLKKTKVNLTGYSDEGREVRSFLQCLPYISHLSFYGWSDSGVKFCGSLFCAAATTERELQSGENTLELLSSVCRHQTFPFTDDDYEYTRCDFFLDLYSHIKNYETKTGSSVLQPMQSFFTSDQTEWSVDLSERKTSILLEVLKLQTEKIHVELRGWSDEESEVRNFLHCLPYISKLSFYGWSDSGVKFCGSLFCAAATTERELQSGENTLELLSSVCRHQTFPFTDDDYEYTRCDFFLDLYSHIKNYETKTGSSVLQPMQSFFTSDQTEWSVDLSERKTSILLEVLKLQTEKIHVELRGWSDEESEVRNFLHCLPYISKLSFYGWSDSGVKFCGSLFCAAATTERELQSGENTLELLSSVCRHQTFPFTDDDYEYTRCDFFLDLYSHIKNYETKTGSSVLQPMQSFFTSDQTEWSVDLSERKTSILLEVLKLQTEKIHVELRGWSDEESEVRNFLHCLPYISKLSFYGWSDSEVKFCGSLFCAAATTERELQSGENTLELLSSVCRHQTFPFTDDDYEYTRCDFFLDLYSHIKNYETKTGSSVLQPMQSFFTSDQTVWSVDLSERKTSILLEVLKLQTEKIHVELRGWSDEESEVRNFLHCLPYISKLSFSDWSDSGVKFCGSLFCAAATTERELQSGENTLELLSSVCRHQTFPFIDDDDDDDYRYTQCNFFLDLYSHIKNYETKTGSSVLQPLQSFFTSDQTVWSVDLSERKTSILLEVLKLQTEKIHVELRGWSDEESEVRNFLHCLPYISKLSFSGWSDSGVKFCGSLFCAAATTERELQSGENTLELLSSVCRHQTSPFIYHNYEYTRCDFFLDLYSHIKNYETQIGSSVLQPLQSFFISDQTEWSVDLSERKTSILLEVLKLQTEKIHVELRGWSDEESEVRNFLHCLPYISKLSCYDQEFFQCVCTSISVRSRDEAEHLVHLLQLLGFTLHLTGKLTSKTCKTVGRVLGLCGSHVDLNLTPSAMSVRGASLLFRHVKTLHSLRLSNSMALLLSGWVRRQEVPCLTVTEQLSLAPQWGPSSERVSLRVVSSLASLLRYWTIRQLDLTESSIPAQSLSSLLLHDGPLKIKLHESLSQQLLNLLCETQDDDFTSAFLRKVNGDLTPFSLNWELLHRLLQLSSQTLTVNLRKNRFLQRSITPLLPFLDRIVFKRPSPRFVLTTIREIYATRSSSVVLSFLRSFDHVISLTCREMDSDDCAALLFTLKHCDGVKLNLLWTSIPTEEIRSILCALDNVSQLSVDRNLLLKLVHCCAASGDLLTTADSLLRALQHRLDLSRSSCAELSEEGQSETLRLTVADCKAVSTVLTRSSSWDTATELHLQDCEVEDSGLDLLFSVLDRVRLRASKVILLQLVALIPLDSMRRAEYLCKALDGELDLSNTELDQGACQALACMLEFSEGLKELDLSYCQLTNQLLHTIKDHLHKVQVLDLSHNKITDASTYTLLGLISNNSSIETVRLFRNNIKHQTLLKTVKKFEIW